MLFENKGGISKIEKHKIKHLPLKFLHYFYCLLTCLYFCQTAILSIYFSVTMRLKILFSLLLLYTTH